MSQIILLFLLPEIGKSILRVHYFFYDIYISHVCYIIIIVNSCPLFSLNPMNITRNVGEKEVFIGCSHRQSVIQAWDIKFGANQTAKRYVQGGVSEAHPHFAPKYELGILIHVITSEMDGTTFQCYYYGRDRSFRSDVGILTVSPQCTQCDYNSTENKLNSTYTNSAPTIISSITLYGLLLTGIILHYWCTLRIY